MAKLMRRFGLLATITAAAMVASSLGPVRESAVAAGGVSYSYDAAGRLASVTDPTGASAQYSYDPVGNLTAISRTPAPPAAAKLAFAPVPAPKVRSVRSTAKGIEVLGENLTGSVGAPQVKLGQIYARVQTTAPDRLLLAMPELAPTPGARLRVVTDGGTDTLTLPDSLTKPKPPNPPNADNYRPLQAPIGVTALAGIVRDPSGAGLSGVRLSVGAARTRSQADGRFLLTGLTPGHHELLVDGTESDRGLFEHGVDIRRGRTTALDWTTWLTRLDTKHRVALPAGRTTVPLVVKNPDIPGLEVQIPPGTSLIGHDGKQVRELGITALNLDRQPFPGAPGMPVAWTLQPGLAEVRGPGLKVIYPNVMRQPPGTLIDYVGHDGERPGLGWYTYGHGRVSANGRQVIPDAKTRIRELYLLSVAFQQPCTGECPEPGPGAEDGDPVDLASGLFLMSQTDLTLPDVSPIALTRTYRQSDNVIRSFGLGQSDAFNSFVTPDSLGRFSVQFPNGSSVPFAPTGIASEYAAVDTPTNYRGATMTRVGVYRFEVRLTTGLRYIFDGYTAALSTMIDRYGNSTRYTRDTTGKVTQITSANGRWISLSWGPCTATLNCITAATDAFGRTVKYTYDANGRLIETTNPAGQKTSYAWNDCTLPLTCTQIKSITDPLGAVYLRNFYDANGRVSRQDQADGTKYQFSYQLRPDGQVQLTSVTDPRGTIRQVEYNTAGYPITNTEAFGTAVEQITRMTRDPISNQITASIDPLGRSSTFTYDAKGNLLAHTEAVGTPKATTSTFTYDPLYQRPTSATNALGKTTTLAYDDDANTITSTDPLGRQSIVTFAEGQPVTSTDALGNTSYLSYLDGQLVAATDPLGRVSRGYWDLAGRLLKSTDALGRRSRMNYDVMNQLTLAVDPLGNVSRASYNANGDVLTRTDPLGRVQNYAYNSMNRLTSHTDALGASTSYSYDADGNLTATVDRNGQRDTFSYDALGRQTTASFKVVGTGPTSTTESRVTLSYDAANRPVSVADTSASTISQTFDVLDQLTSQSAPGGTVSYNYDRAGRRTGMTVPGQGTTTYGYDDASQLTAITRGTVSTAMTYDQAGRPASVTLPGGVKQSYAFDARSQLTAINYTKGASTLGGLTYSYDAAGQPLTVGGSFARSSLPPAWSGATYDANNRLTKLGTKTLSYDPQGRMLSDGTANYTWNARHQLVASTSPAASYSYDAVDRRSSKTVGGVTTGYTYDGANAVQERVGGVVSADLLTGLGADQTLARTAAGATSALLTDRMGSTIALTDATGALTTSYTYDPYGRTISSGPATANPSQFAGRENDGTGLYFNRARYYSPSLQRFISADPAGAAGSGANLYEYVGSSPTQFTDPTGMFANVVAGAVIGAVAGVAIGWATAALTGRKYSWGDAARDALMGAAFGAIGAGMGNLIGRGLAAARGTGAAAGGAGAGVAGGGAAAGAGATAPALPAALTAGANAQAGVHVYTGVRNGVNTYVGISNNVARRQAEHGARFQLQQMTGSAGLTRGQARAVEQAMIVRNPGFTNVRNSISPSHSYYDDAVAWGENWLRSNGF